MNDRLLGRSDGLSSERVPERAPPLEEDRDRVQFIARLYERHSRTLLWYLTSLMPNREDAEEVVQAAYLRLLGASGLEVEEGRARSYLFKTAKNLVNDSFRRRKARCEHLHVDIDTLELTSDQPRPDQLADRDICTAILRTALHDISPRSRSAFVLHFDERMTYQHIADALGVSKKTVERDISMVLQLCRSRLDALAG